MQGPNEADDPRMGADNLTPEEAKNSDRLGKIRSLFEFDSPMLGDGYLAQDELGPNGGDCSGLTRAEAFARAVLWLVKLYHGELRAWRPVEGMNSRHEFAFSADHYKDGMYLQNIEEELSITHSIGAGVESARDETKKAGTL